MDELFIKINKIVNLEELINRKRQTYKIDSEWLSKINNHELEQINKIINDFNSYNNPTDDFMIKHYRYQFIFSRVKHRLDKDYHKLKNSLQLIKRVTNGK